MPSSKKAAQKSVLDHSGVIFFDIGGTLGSPEFSNGRLTGIRLFPGVLTALADLKKSHRLGVISNTGGETFGEMENLLTGCGLWSLLDPGLALFSSVTGLPKDSPAAFRAALRTAGVDSAIFTGEDWREQQFAAQAGLRTYASLEKLLAGLNPPAHAVAYAAVAGTDFGNLDACIKDAVAGWKDGDPGPADPLDYQDLLRRVEAARHKLPPVYRESFADPYLRTMRGLGAAEFQRILNGDPGRERLAGLTLDIAQVILQNGEDYQSVATDALQEVVSDLYDGFLSAQDRRHINLPDHAVLAPLVKWGQPDFGPYTWPVTAVRQPFGMSAALVNMPPANARLGLLAWAALPHETAGHDVLHANDGLQEELANAVFDNLTNRKFAHGLPEYWAERIDETASDVMGVLNMGPAAALGIIGYFRALRGGKLSSNGPVSDSHPADILRGWLGAATAARLQFDDAAAWESALYAETDRDAGLTVRLAGQTVPKGIARESAKVVAEIIATHRCESLSRHALADIQNWRNHDEQIASSIGAALHTLDNSIPDAVINGAYAAHAVAGAVTAAVAANANVALIFGRMLGLLKKMHDRNPSWGPLFITHPGMIAMHRAVEDESVADIAEALLEMLGDPDGNTNTPLSHYFPDDAGLRNFLSGPVRKRWGVRVTPGEIDPRTVAGLAAAIYKRLHPEE